MSRETVLGIQLARDPCSWLRNRRLLRSVADRPMPARVLMIGCVVTILPAAMFGPLLDSGSL